MSKCDPVAQFSDRLTMKAIFTGLEAEAFRSKAEVFRVQAGLFRLKRGLIGFKPGLFFLEGKSFPLEPLLFPFEPHLSGLKEVQPWLEPFQYPFEPEDFPLQQLRPGIEPDLFRLQPRSLFLKPDRFRLQAEERFLARRRIERACGSNGRAGRAAHGPGRRPLLHGTKTGPSAMADGPVCKPFGRDAAGYFFLALAAGLAAALRFSSIAAWAAARRATGTRYGEQLT